MAAPVRQTTPIPAIRSSGGGMSSAKKPRAAGHSMTPTTPAPISPTRIRRAGVQGRTRIDRNQTPIAASTSVASVDASGCLTPGSSRASE